jgi:hypothetical protein
VVAELLGNPKGPAEEPAALQRKLMTPALAPLRFMQDTHTQYHATQTLVAPILLHFSFLCRSLDSSFHFSSALVIANCCFGTQSKLAHQTAAEVGLLPKNRKTEKLLGFGEFRRLLYPR